MYCPYNFHNLSVMMNFKISYHLRNNLGYNVCLITHAEASQHYYVMSKISDAFRQKYHEQS